MSPSRIPHSTTVLRAADIEALARIARSGQIAGGREVARLEEDFAARFGFRHAVAVSTGSAALHLSLIALGIRPGQRVLAPSYVCAAVLNAIRYVGAREVLVDSAPAGFNLDSTTRQQMPVAAAIVPHLFGYPAALTSVARPGLVIIEDCAMAIGATTPAGHPVGHRGDAAIYSFYATKPVAGGEGGLVATDHDAVADAVRDLREYDKRDDWKLRYNYKLTDLQAALIRSQLARLDSMVQRRRRLAARYGELLADTSLVLPPLVAGATYYRYVVRSSGGFHRAWHHFRRRGIEVARPVYLPLHRCVGQPYRRFPYAEELFLTAISLPIYPTLALRDLRRVAAAATEL